MLAASAGGSQVATAVILGRHSGTMSTLRESFRKRSQQQDSAQLVLHFYTMTLSLQDLKTWLIFSASLRPQS